MNRKLTLCFTSDVHGYLYPTDYVSPQEKDLGLLKLASAFPRDGNTLIMDAGDMIQGSPMMNLYHRMDDAEKSSLVSDQRYGRHPFAAVMNLAGYQYITLGNHDFNNGIKGLKDYLSDLKARCICCNIRDKAGELPIVPWTIHTLENGLRIGIVGACTDFVAKWENPATVAELDIREPVAACREALETIKPLCDVSVLLYHGGFECDLEDGHLLTESTENQGGRICVELDFDFVLTGHQHVSIPCRRFANSWVAQPGHRGVEYCLMEADVSDDGVQNVIGRNIPAAAKPKAEAIALVQTLENKTQQWLDTPVGHLDIPLEVGDHIDMGLNGSLLANFINHVTTELTGAQISATALANEASGLPKDVTIRNVVGAYIYSNTSVVLEMNAADLKRYMERCADYFAPQPDGTVTVSDDFLYPKVQHYNYDFFSGIDYVIDLRKAPGNRIVSMMIDGRQITGDEVVSVCISSYRFNGTGGYDMLPGQKVLKDVQIDTADAIIDFILRHPNITVDRHQWCKVILS